MKPRFCLRRPRRLAWAVCVVLIASLATPVGICAQEDEESTEATTSDASPGAVGSADAPAPTGAEAVPGTSTAPPATERPFSLALNSAADLPFGVPGDLFVWGTALSLGASWAIPAIPWLVVDAQLGTGYLQARGVIGSVGVVILPIAIGASGSWSLSERLSLHAGAGGGPFAAFIWDDIAATMEWSGWLTTRVGAGYRLSPAFSLSLDLVYREFFGLTHDLGLQLSTAFHFGAPRVREPRERRVKPEPTPQPLELSEEPAPVPEEEPAVEVAEAPVVEPELEPEPEPAPEPAVEEEPRVVLETGFGTMELEINPIFPVFYSYYDDHPVGTATITNTGRRAVEDVSVSFYVGQYMDNPKTSAVIGEIASKGTETVDVYGLFTSNILEITEGTKLSALFTVTYTERGTQRTNEFVETIEAHNRNALTWDDDRKICAFVTAKDPSVMRFARNVTGFIQGSLERAVNTNLMMAMGLHEALNCYGLHYIPDPTTPYTELSGQSTVIDYLLFPRQTLEYQGGDCDDLSALYCALLESIGVETAFITIPGHIYMAFSLGISPDEARGMFEHPDELIFREGSAWVPIEITLRDKGFLAAWQLGAKEWRENQSRGQTAFYPVRQAWELYKPVGLPGSSALNPLDDEEICAAFAAEFLAFVEREIASEVAHVQVRIDNDPRNPRWPNRLGILHARYAVYDRAISYLDQALELRDNYLPALVNLGNIHYLNGDVFTALDYYETAERQNPDNPEVLLNLARVNHDLENYGTARRAYERLQAVSPSMANRFAYLGLRGEEAARATEAGDVEGVIFWVEEGGDE